MRMEEVWLIGTAAVALPLLVVCAIGWWRASRQVRYLTARLLDSPQADDTTQRLEQAVEGLATQVEDLASGQEFFQRVLTSRLQQKPAPRAVEPPKEPTPV